MDHDSNLFLPPSRFDVNANDCESPNWLKRWRKGDKIFKGIFSAGVTPKIQRPLKQLIKPVCQPLLG